MSDPNGWVTNPPATIVKVVNTSREVLNGKLGIVLAYQSDRGRYVIAMAVSQEQVSLKPDNLVKGSWMEQLQAQYEFMKNNPQVQQQLQTYYRRVQQMTGQKPEYVAAAAGVVLLACIYFFGFSRIMLVVSFAMLVALVVQPDLASGRSARDVVRNAPMRFKETIRQNVPMIGHRIANSNMLTGLVFGVMMFFFVNALVGGGGASRAAAPMTPGGGAATPYVPTTKPVMDRKMLEDYYKMGFYDGKDGLDFGTSLPVVEIELPKGVDAGSNFDWVPPPVAPTPSILSKLTNWSSMLSLYVVGSTLYKAGQTADGGFDPQLMVANLRMLDAWKQGMLALSVYRLVSPFFS
eukprot:scaffold2103_cov185-Amphora_coffeaeformis.AAC.9